MWAYTKGGCLVSFFIALCSNPLRQALSLNLRLTLLTRMTTSQTVLSLLPNDGAVCTLRTTLSLRFRSWDLSSGFHPCTEGFPVEYSLHFLLQSFNSLLFTFTDYSIQWAFQVKCLLLFCFLKTIIHKYLEHTFSISGFLCYFFQPE